MTDDEMNDAHDLYFVEVIPPKLFDKWGNEKIDPDELNAGDFFYIFPKEPSTHYELMQNPFDVGPAQFAIEGLPPLYPEARQSDEGVDLWLVRVTEHWDKHTGLCEVEAKVHDVDGLLEKLESLGQIPKESETHHFEILNRGSAISEDDVRGSLNELLKGHL